MQLIEVKDNSPKARKVSLAPRKERAKAEARVEHKSLSDNIQAFDNRARATRSFDYNSISLGDRKVDQRSPTPTPFAMIASPFYNSIGKFLGVDTQKEWGRDYDKVYEITEWAKKKVKSDSADDVIQFLYNKIQSSPSIGSRRIDDMFIMTKLSSEPTNKPEVKTKTVVKEVVKVRRVKEKPEKPKENKTENMEQFVNSWIKGTLGATQ